MTYINVTVSQEDYDKIKDIEEAAEVQVAFKKGVKGILLQTSSAQYILFTVGLT